MRDLIVLCADQDANLGLDALLARGPSLGFRAIDLKMARHINRDNGVFQQAHEFLRSQHKLFAHALAICDFEGCGRERAREREEVEALIEQRLNSNGWSGRAAAVVIQPELESWIWGDWRALAQEIRWNGGEESLRSWLIERGLITPAQPKPHRPKEALERVLRQVNRAASSSLFAALGRVGDSTPCSDPAFRKLLTQLQLWFPIQGNAT